MVNASDFGAEACLFGKLPKLSYQGRKRWGLYTALKYLFISEIKGKDYTQP